jgi:hypothetical protein
LGGTKQLKAQLDALKLAGLKKEPEYNKGEELVRKLHEDNGMKAQEMRRRSAEIGRTEGAAPEQEVDEASSNKSDNIKLQFWKLQIGLRSGSPLQKEIRWRAG